MLANKREISFLFEKLAPETYLARLWEFGDVWHLVKRVDIDFRHVQDLASFLEEISNAQQVQPLKNSSTPVRGENDIARREASKAGEVRLRGMLEDRRGIRRKSRRSITRGAYNSRFNAQFEDVWSIWIYACAGILRPR